MDFPLGQKLWQHFQAHGPEPLLYKQKLPAFRGEEREKFFQGKKTLVVSLWRGGQFQSCKPSAHWQLPLISGCPGHCQYCYLHTNLAKRPYIKINVNREEILSKALALSQMEPTVFEGAATSDPVAVEPLTGSLEEAIRFFAKTPQASFRFVTKFTDIESLLQLEHGGKTQIRFSLNCERITTAFEAGVPSLAGRLKASAKVADAGYPLGFLIGPIMAIAGWQAEYEKMLIELAKAVPEATYTFELVSHRFTSRAKKSIDKIYPGHKLPLESEERTFRYGQFGYGKYVYPKPLLEELENFFREKINHYFPESEILYFV